MKRKVAYRVTLFFPGVCNLHKHSIFFLRPIGPFVQYSLRPKEEWVRPRTQWRTLDTCLAQLVRASHRYREVTGSHPVEVLTFSGFCSQLLKLRSKLRWSWLTWFEVRSAMYERFHISLRYQHCNSKSKVCWSNLLGPSFTSDSCYEIRKMQSIAAFFFPYAFSFIHISYILAWVFMSGNHF